LGHAKPKVRTGSDVRAERFINASATVQWTNYLMAGGELVGIQIARDGQPTHTRYLHTDQLRDFAAYSRTNLGWTFDLYVRPTTQLSGPLQQAIANGDIILRFIP
jgi:hypothetical protein